MEKEPTISDVLIAMNEFADRVDKRFDDVQAELRREIASAITSTEDKLITHIDGFITLHQTLDIEFISLRSRSERMESFIVRAAKKLEVEYEQS